MGSFHFEFPNRDITKVDRKDQIDVLESRHQLEIENVVKHLIAFKPTIIAIEAQPDRQYRVDSLLQKYLQGQYTLGRNEYEQIGFRLAKSLGIRKTYCVDTWGIDYDYLNGVLENKDTAENRRFMKYFYHHPDSLLEFKEPPMLVANGVYKELQRINHPEWARLALGDYLIGIFKYETKKEPYFGPDFVTGWWFNRNLRIFRNIQKIGARPEDRILVIFGSGHLTILNTLFGSSPEFNLVDTGKYLK